MILLYSLIGNIIVQIPNLLAIHYFGYEMTLRNAIKLAAFTSPLSVMATLTFTIYFAKSTETLNYGIVNLVNIGINILIGLIVGVFILKSQQLHWLEYLGVAFVITGILIIINKDYILNLIGSF